MNKKNLSLAVFLAVLAIGVIAGVRYFSDQRSGAASAASRYYCPMHPEFTSDRPGECPICNMALIAMEEKAAGVPDSKGTTLSGKRVCVLHKCNMANCKMEVPLKPGERVDCPVCGTHVAEPIKAGEPLYYRHPMRPEITAAEPKKDEMGMDYIPVYAEEASGAASFSIPPERRRLIGMTTGVVERKALSSTVRASGRVAYDPDLFNAINELRAAVRAREQVKDSPYPDARERSESLVRASILRLRQMGLSQIQIDSLAQSDDAQTNLLLGEAGGTVWVYAQIYEYEIGLIKPGQSAKITTPAYPGQTFRGTVKAVDPILDPQTRSLKTRIEVPNPAGKLKLEMFVDAEIEVPIGKVLTVPESAVLDTGSRQLVFVDLGEGRLEPREVRLGRQAQDRYEVLAGLREGEAVVTSANFLVDSESKLKSAVPRASPQPAGEHKH